MLVKFDHISFIAPKDMKTEILKNKNQPLFTELSLKNLEIKRNLMRTQHLEHDLYFYEGDYPVEYIFYNKVENQGAIKLVDGILYGHYNDRGRAVDFLKGIFGNKVTEDGDYIRCNMKGILDKRDYFLILERTDEIIDSYIDNGGYGVVALINNSTFSKVPVDGICTPTEVLTVNGKDLEICFTKSDSTDIIFEIIRIKR